MWNRRRLLRFSVKVENRGLDHFRPHADKSTWEWHECHEHYHSMETFSSYDLIREYEIDVFLKGFQDCLTVWIRIRHEDFAILGHF